MRLAQLKCQIAVRVTLLILCTTLAVFAEALSSEDPQGVYLGQDGNLSLSVTLRDDGCYRVDWLSKAEAVGNSRGRWTKNGDSITLKHYSAGGSSGLPQYSHMVELKELRLVRGEHHFMLVPDWHFEALQREGASAAIVCYWQRNAPAPQIVPADQVPVVSIQEVVAKKKEFKGKRVGVIGDYRSGFELSVLQDPAAEPDRNARLWIGFGVAEWAKDEDVQRRKQGRVKVVGTLTYNEVYPGHEGSYGHMGMCPAGIVDVEYFKPLESTSRHEETNSASGR